MDPPGNRIPLPDFFPRTDSSIQFDSEEEEDEQQLEVVMNSTDQQISVRKVEEEQAAIWLESPPQVVAHRQQNPANLQHLSNEKVLAKRTAMARKKQRASLSRPSVARQRPPGVIVKGGLHSMAHEQQRASLARPSGAHQRPPGLIVKGGLHRHLLPRDLLVAPFPVGHQRGSNQNAREEVGDIPFQEPSGEEPESYSAATSTDSLEPNVMQAENGASASDRSSTEDSLEANRQLNTRLEIPSGSAGERVVRMHNHVDDSELVQARPVADEGTLLEAKQVDPEELERLAIRRQKAQQCRRVGYCLIAGALTIILGTVLGTRDHRKDEIIYSTPEPAPEVNATTSTTNVPNETDPPDPIKDDPFYAGLPNYTLAALNDPQSPQRQAYQWLLDYPNVIVLPDWRWQQLFALASFYYSFAGPTWPGGLAEDWMDFERPECVWFSSDFGDFGTYLGLQDADYTENKADPNDPDLQEWVSVNYFLQHYQNYSIDQPPCNDEGHFSSLYLSNTLTLQNDAVEIPPELALLTSLQYILLDGNIIQAPLSKIIPEELTLLSDLREIDLSRNELLLGTIPPYFGRLSSLERFEAYTNDLTGTLPPSIGFMSHMKILDLSENELSGWLPTELGLMARLGGMDLQHNYFSGAIPSSIGMLTNLWNLDLSYNSFTGSVPTEIFLLTKLQILYLDHSQMHQMPSQLSLLTDLTDFALVGYGPNTTGFPVEVFNQTTPITKLDLSGQSLTGTLPTFIGTLTDLNILALSNNQLSGPIPSQLGLCTDMVFLDLSNNTLTASIPQELGKLFNKNYLVLGGQVGESTMMNFSFNLLTGSIASEIGQCTGLLQLDLMHNALSGNIVTELALLSDLVLLDLSTNALAGPVPDELAMLNAQIIYLEDNSLTGLIPTVLGLLSNTMALDLRNNLLHGPIPTELGSITDLIFIHAGMNSLTGTLPVQLGLLRGGPPYFRRLSFYFQDNLLTGTIPSEYADRAAEGILIAFAIRGNDISGTLPSEFCFLQDDACEWAGAFTSADCFLSFDCSDDLCGCNCTCN